MEKELKAMLIMGALVVASYAAGYFHGRIVEKDTIRDKLYNQLVHKADINRDGDIDKDERAMVLEEIGRNSKYDLSLKLLSQKEMLAYISDHH